MLGLKEVKNFRLWPVVLVLEYTRGALHVLAARVRKLKPFRSGGMLAACAQTFEALMPSWQKPFRMAKLFQVRSLV